MCIFKISSIYFPSWRRYTFLSHLTTKSKISTSPVKKLVAATYGVYQFLQSTFNFIAKITANTPSNLRGYFDEMCRKLNF